MDLWTERCDGDDAPPAGDDIDDYCGERILRIVLWITEIGTSESWTPNRVFLGQTDKKEILEIGS
jgi:hypothetical protein